MRQLAAWKATGCRFYDNLLKLNNTGGKRLSLIKLRTSKAWFPFLALEHRMADIRKVEASKDGANDRRAHHERYRQVQPSRFSAKVCPGPKLGSLGGQRHSGRNKNCLGRGTV